MALFERNQASCVVAFKAKGLEALELSREERARMATAIAPARTALADPGNPLSVHGLVTSDPAEKF